MIWQDKQITVDLPAKVLQFEKYAKISGRGTKTSGYSDRVLAQNSDVVLAVVVI